MTVRPLRPDEGPAAHALWARSAPLDPVSYAVLAETLWGEPAGPALAAEHGGRLVGLAGGALWPTPAALRGSVRLLAVDPDHRRRGVGTALLRAVEGALRRDGAGPIRLLEAAPNYLTPGVDARNDGALAFAAARGYRDVGEAVNLAADLRQDWGTQADERRLARLGVSVRRFDSSDGAALDRLLDAEWPAWHAEVARARALDPPALHVAVRAGEAIGFAAHSANNAPLGWFGPMGTAPAARGLGVGGVLLRRCLADLRAAGHERATIAWAAALPFYARACGATVDRRFRRLEAAADAGT